MKGKGKRDLAEAKATLENELHLVRPLESQRKIVAKMEAEKLKVSANTQQQPVGMEE
jgi:hypothetical protein